MAGWRARTSRWHALRLGDGTHQLAEEERERESQSSRAWRWHVHKLSFHSFTKKGKVYRKILLLKCYYYTVLVPCEENSTNHRVSTN